MKNAMRWEKRCQKALREVREENEVFKRELKVKDNEMTRETTHRVIGPTLTTW